LRSGTAILSRNDLYQVSAWSNTSGQVLGVEPTGEGQGKGKQGANRQNMRGA